MRACSTTALLTAQLRQKCCLRMESYGVSSHSTMTPRLCRGLGTFAYNKCIQWSDNRTRQMELGRSPPAGAYLTCWAWHMGRISNFLVLFKKRANVTRCRILWICVRRGTQVPFRRRESTFQIPCYDVKVLTVLHQYIRSTRRLRMDMYTSDIHASWNIYGYIFIATYRYLSNSASVHFWYNIIIIKFQLCWDKSLGTQVVGGRIVHQRTAYVAVNDVRKQLCRQRWFCRCWGYINIACDRIHQDLHKSNKHNLSCTTWNVNCIVRGVESVLSIMLRSFRLFRSVILLRDIMPVWLLSSSFVVTHMIVWLRFKWWLIKHRTSGQLYETCTTWTTMTKRRFQLCKTWLNDCQTWKKPINHARYSFEEWMLTWRRVTLSACASSCA